MKILIILLLIILLVLAAILVAVRSNLCIIDNKKYVKKGGGMVSIKAIGSFIEESGLTPLSSEEINSFAAYLALFFKDDGDFLSVKHSTERDDAYMQWWACNEKMKKGEYDEYYLNMDLGDITKELYKFVKKLNEINSQPKGPRNDTIKQSIVKNIVKLFNAKRKKELDDEKLAQSFSYDANVYHMPQQIPIRQQQIAIRRQELEDEELARRKQAVENEKLDQILKDEEFAKEFEKKLNGENNGQRSQSEYRSLRDVSRSHMSHRPHRQIETQEYQIGRPLRSKAKTLATKIQELEDVKFAKKLEKELNSENTEQIPQSAYINPRDISGPQESLNQYSAFNTEILARDTQPRDSKKYSLSDYVPSNSASSRGYDSSPRGYGSSHLKSSASSSSGYASSLSGYASSSRGYDSSKNRFTPVIQTLGNEDPKNISSEEDIIKKKIAELKQRIKNYEDSYYISPNDSILDAITVCRDNIIRLESQLLKIERAKKYANFQKR